ncbi:hypothetical protein [Maritimibacter sp. DP1N21-5]|uniref:hypothetical protein n=1 Tax=Maritimibacter sp. DP1N21-5 TaxID=2836867 RepID=UPI001C473CE4|nr:hypothetical protein [Maritimibacter sp. DP1N21-5]MBV7409638.1 hypothetical protein [Maritimibacter sp. DP1N21-5]
MRRTPSELPYTGRSWVDEPQRVQTYDHDNYRNLTFHAGRYFRDESTIRDPDYSAKADDLKAIRERSAEEAEDRQARKDANFARALELGAALKVLRGEA